MYINIFITCSVVILSIKERVINSLHPVGWCNPACYPPSVIQITLGSASWDLAGLHYPTGRN